MPSLVYEFFDGFSCGQFVRKLSDRRQGAAGCAALQTL